MVARVWLGSGEVDSRLAVCCLESKEATSSLCHCDPKMSISALIMEV